MKKLILAIFILTFFSTLTYSETVEIVEIYYGNTPTIVYTVKDENEDPSSLTGYTVKFRLCASEDDKITENYVLNLSMTNATQSGATLGQATRTLTKANTSQTPGDYYLYFDIVILSGETEVFLWTSNKFILRILK